MKGTRLKGYLTVNEMERKYDITNQGILDLIINEKLKPVKHIGNFYLIPLKSIEKLRRQRAKSKDGRVKPLELREENDNEA
jgi:hypothetical protein